MIPPGTGGLCRLDAVMKAKMVELVKQSCEIGPDERWYAERLYPMVKRRPSGTGQPLFSGFPIAAAVHTGPYCTGCYFAFRVLRADCNACHLRPDGASN